MGLSSISASPLSTTNLLPSTLPPLNSTPLPLPPSPTSILKEPPPQADFAVPLILVIHSQKALACPIHMSHVCCSLQGSLSTHSPKPLRDFSCRFWQHSFRDLCLILFSSPCVPHSSAPAANTPDIDGSVPSGKRVAAVHLSHFG